MRSFVLTLPAILFIFSATLLQAQTISVPEAHTTIQFAIDAAEDGDTVLVADGTYTGWGNRDIDFQGKAIVVLSVNGPDSCIIDCGASAGDQHRGFIFQSGEGPASVLEGFTIKRGYKGTGGAIRINGSSPTISGNVIYNCKAYSSDCQGKGGGIWLSNSEARIVGNTLSNNSSQVWGGGIYCEESVPLIENNMVRDNYVGTYYNGLGGGICLFYSSGEIINNVIENNQCTHSGGGISTAYCSPLIIRGNIISGNTAGTAYGNGGGVALYVGQYLVESNLIYGNMVMNPYGEYDCGQGGGIAMCENVNNTWVDLFGNTIAYNVAEYKYGGVFADHYSHTEMNNCVLWGNSGGGHPSIGVGDGGVFLSVTYSDIEGGWEGEGNFEEAPSFVDHASDDYHLRSDSPCINAGNPDYVAEPGETDIDGQARVMNGRIDMGVDEFCFPHHRLPEQR